MKDAILLRAADATNVPMPSGSLKWFASGQLGNSDAMTLGFAVLPPGGANPLHFHPNCEEVLHVLEGRILHTMGDTQSEMGPGDTVSIPAMLVHNAKNIGDGEARLLICFSSADRQTVWA
jgi:quercetin dioxygenase-like cupin family protein